MRRILVVDDSALMRALYRQALARGANVSVRYASDGQEALAEIAASEPHIVFLDINMPGMDGFEVLSHLRRSKVLERVPVVLVSTEGKEDDLERGRAAGAVDYLPKPFPLGAPMQRVDRLVPHALACATVRPPTSLARGF